MTASEAGKGGALSPGARLGPYEVSEKIGSGGMGEVYRATDTQLKRDVAIKVLPALFTEDRERLGRFEREAQLLAQLHHPHIASIFGIAEAEGVRALVMELVEGPTLAERLASGPLPLDDCLTIALQIAEALEDAHEKGIVHRDLKPANIKLTPDGKVKVLDFGLAKAMDPQASSSDVPSASLSPTLTMGATVQGVILGTAAYMAPEQAAGKPVDRRADIFSFGVVLYEMLTGGRLFGGESVSHVLASVLKDEPDFSALPKATPEPLVTLLRRCLRKKPRRRLQAIGDARVVIEEVIEGPGAFAREAEPSAASSKLPWLVAGAAVLVALALAAVAIAPRPPSSAPRSLHASIQTPPGTILGETFALSPDGRRLAFQAYDAETGGGSLWLRDLEEGEAQPLKDTDGAEMPFWSPDGTQLGFFAEGAMKRIDPRGGPPRVVAPAPVPRGGTWGEDGWIVYSPTFRDGLFRVRADGGASTKLTELDTDRGEKSHRFPVFLPGEDSILFLAQTAEGGAANDESSIELLDLDSGTRTQLVRANSSPLFSRSGFLFFWRDGALVAQAFDAKTQSVLGDTTILASSVAYTRNEQLLAAVSDEGTLVFQEAESTGQLSISSPGPTRGDARSEIFVLDRQGLETQLVQGGQAFGDNISLSHDGRRLLSEGLPPGQGAWDLWLHDLDRGTQSRFTFSPSSDSWGVWSPDDRWIYYANDAENDGVVFRRRSDGTGAPERIGTIESGIWPLDISTDGRWLVAGGLGSETSFDLLRFDLETAELSPLVATPFVDVEGILSPDNRLLAYASEESGRLEIFVAGLGTGGGKWQVSTDGGARPRWKADGRELYYLAPPDRVMVVDVEPGEVPRFAAPRVLFRTSVRNFEPAPDGESFIALRRSGQSSDATLRLITNWTQRVTGP